MISLDSITNENNNEHNKKMAIYTRLFIQNLIHVGSGSGKPNALFNLIKEQDDIDKICLYAKDLRKAKYGFWIKKHEDVQTNHFNDLNAFIEFSNTMDDVYENIDNNNTNRQRKILVVFDDMIADIMSNKKFQTIIEELFVSCRKLNMSLVFII